MFDHLGEALLLLRLLRRSSQRELAAKAGIRANQLSRYETGAVLPQLGQLQRILDALGVGLPDLLFVLSAVERIASLVADSDRRQPPEQIAAQAAVQSWEDVADRHLAVAEHVVAVVQQQLGGERV